MDMYEYQVIIDRIKEIENEQLQWLNYISESLDNLVDVQKENVMERMLQLRDEWDKLQEYINKSSIQI